jgi:hypothetical protein
MPHAELRAQSGPHRGWKLIARVADDGVPAVSVNLRVRWVICYTPGEGVTEGKMSDKNRRHRAERTKRPGAKVTGDDGTEKEGTNRSGESSLKDAGEKVKGAFTM